MTYSTTAIDSLAHFNGYGTTIALLITGIILLTSFIIVNRELF